jgi:hypothetical protein
MSITGTRRDLAAALTAVADVTGYEYRPATPTVGDAWPVMGPLNRDAGTAFLVTWAVRVLVPQDEAVAAEWLDAHWPALFEVLEHVGSVERAEPILLPLVAGDLLAFEITIRAEE